MYACVFPFPFKYLLFLHYIRVSDPEGVKKKLWKRLQNIMKWKRGAGGPQACHFLLPPSSLGRGTGLVSVGGRVGLPGALVSSRSLEPAVLGRELVLGPVWTFALLLPADSHSAPHRPRSDCVTSRHARRSVGSSFRSLSSELSRASLLLHQTLQGLREGAVSNFYMYLHL